MQGIGQFDSPFVRPVAVALARYELSFEHLQPESRRAPISAEG
ncbi:MAG TPA: hypothetical protein VKY73_19010 [Polyangiaceae bacterium]|nr:hypothetical protein [Polyangiaceae bacterium]